MKRKEPLKTGKLYHVLNKSIAGYKIFVSEKDCERIKQIFRFFAVDDPSLPKFSRFIEYAAFRGKNPEELLAEKAKENGKLVRIVAYCIMPTHFHLILEQLKEDGISTFTGKTSNAYARHFNTKHNRQGRLWQDKFKNVLVHTNEQLLHLTRYIHLNPVSAGLTEKPEEWKYSSYLEYMTPEKVKYPLCEFKDLIDTPLFDYRQFVEDRADYQNKISKIKGLLLE